MALQKYRLVTRSDFDGLACAVLLNELQMIDDILFVHPKDMQDGKVAIGPRDITTNLPYVPGAHLVFDHHASENLRSAGKNANHVIHEQAPSAARVVYESYGGSKRFPGKFDDMMFAVDKSDSADFTLDDILEPKGWVLLSYLMDSRTGLGRFRNFRVSNYQLMMDLIEHVAHLGVDDVLALPDIEERVDMYFYHADRAKAQILRCTTVDGKVAVLDLRQEDPIYATNRFMVYALHPQVNVSIHVMRGAQKQNTVLATGKSILDRSSRTHIGALMLSQGGGGHAAAGSCQVDNAQADRVLAELIAAIHSDIGI
jgi:nanoRNase/pAp phosphatase (c-di-AMP/oligoRNAs hydrolase)